jgi:hypothetical protein
MKDEVPRFIRKFARKYNCESLIIEKDINGNIDLIIVSENNNVPISTGALKRVVEWFEANIGDYYMYNYVPDELIENNPLWEAEWDW